MSYIDENLMQDENLIYQTKLHWFIFVLPVYLLFGVLLSLVAIKEASPFLIVLIPVLFVISAWIDYSTSEFAVTNRRVIIKVGWLRTISLDLLLGQIESVLVNQGILGRIFDFGTVVVIGTGGTKQPFRMVAHPLVFRKHVQEQILLNQRLKNNN